MKMVLPIAVALSGCAATLSGFQPAHVPQKHHVQAEAGFDVSVPVGTITRTIDAAESLSNAAKNRSLTTDERNQVVEAGTNLALDPPALVAHAGIAWAPFDRWEIGLRASSGAWRAGVRRQLLVQETHGWDLTVGLGLQRFSYKFPVGDFVGVLALEDFTRWSVDVPVIAGKRGDWYRLWGGPRLVLSKYSSRLRLDLPATGSTAAETIVATVDGDATLIALQGGVALGYRHLFIGVELTVARLFSQPTLDVGTTRFTPDIGGWIIYPGVALLGEF